MTVAAQPPTSASGAFCTPAVNKAPLTVREALGRASQRLAAAGCDSPRLDAELLLAHVLGVDRARLTIEPDRGLTSDQAHAFEALVARRERREPVAYILGRKAFRHIELEVDPRVLIPRPETELLVEAALDLPWSARVVDVGTGSGAVALALKHERPDLVVVGIDVSPGALDVASSNARRLGLDVDFVLGDLLSGVERPVDAVVANLPYVADTEVPALPPEVAAHEPRVALAAGRDGLAHIRRLIAQAAEVPFLALEVGAGQAGDVRALLEASRRTVQTLPDLAGSERVMVGRLA